jgi:hypothetical protein
MIVAVDIITALIVAGVLSYLFARNLSRQGQRSGFFWFFLMIFMLTWACGVWLMPADTPIPGSRWLPFLIVGLAGAVVVSFLAGRRYPTCRHETIDLLERIEEGRELEKVTYLSLNILFWIVLFVLLAAILFRYALR